MAINPLRPTNDDPNNNKDNNPTSKSPHDRAIPRSPDAAPDKLEALRNKKKQEVKSKPATGLFAAFSKDEVIEQTPAKIKEDKGGLFSMFGSQDEEVLPEETIEEDSGWFSSPKKDVEGDKNKETEPSFWDGVFDSKKKEEGLSEIGKTDETTKDGKSKDDKNNKTDSDDNPGNSKDKASETGTGSGFKIGSNIRPNQEQREDTRIDSQSDNDSRSTFSTNDTNSSSNNRKTYTPNRAGSSSNKSNSETSGLDETTDSESESKTTNNTSASSTQDRGLLSSGPNYSEVENENNSENEVIGRSDSQNRGNLRRPKSNLIKTPSNTGADSNSVSNSTNTASGSNRNRYVSSGNGGSKVTFSGNETTTSTNLSFDTTNSKTIIRGKKKFNVDRTVIRSQKQDAKAVEKTKNSPKKGLSALKLGLIGLAAAVGLAGVSSVPDKASGIFGSQNTFADQLNNSEPTSRTAFEDSKSLTPEASDEFGVKQKGYDPDGEQNNDNDSAESKTSQDNTDANSKKQSDNSSQNKQNSESENSKSTNNGYDGNVGKNDAGQSNKTVTRTEQAESKSASPAGAPAPFTAGGYDDTGRLSSSLQEKTGFEDKQTAKSAQNQGSNKSKSNSNSAPPSQRGRTGKRSAPARSFNMDGKGSEQINPTKLFLAMVKPYIVQAAFFLILALIIGLIIFGIASFAMNKILSNVCAFDEYAKTINSIVENPASKIMVKTCAAYKELTGIGCGGSSAVQVTGVDCIGKALDGPNETLNLYGLRGQQSVKKACIKEIIDEGLKASVDPNAIMYAIALHPIESSGDCFKTVDANNCIGIARFCPGIYEKAIKGLDVKSTQDYLASPSIQLKSLLVYIKERNEFFDYNAKPCLVKGSSDKGYFYKSSSVWYNEECLDFVNDKGEKKSDFTEALTKNLQQMECNEFKAKIKIPLKVEPTAFKGPPSLNLTAQAQVTGPTVSTKESQEKLITYFESGKIIPVLSTKGAYYADIRGQKSPESNHPDNPINGPPNQNTVDLMMKVADKYPGWTISSLGNNTHSDSGGNHNNSPSSAFDIDTLKSGIDTEDQDTPTMNELMKFLLDSNVILAIGLPPGDMQRLDQDLLKKLKAFTDGPGHVHVSVNATGTLTGGSNSSGGGCSFQESNKPELQDAPKASDRLNGKSLTEGQWAEQQKIYGKIYTGDKFLQIGNDTIFGSAPTKVLFDNKEASEKIYKLAGEAGYKQTIDAPQGDLVGKGEQRLRSSTKKALDEFAAAAKLDGISLELRRGYISPDDLKTSFEKAMQVECNNAISANCSPSDIASGKHDDIVKKVLTKSAVPGYSKQHAGTVATLAEPGGKPIETMTSTKLYKYMTDDNYFNLKRFGFVPSFPKDATNAKGTYQEPMQIIYVGKDATKYINPNTAN